MGEIITEITSYLRFVSYSNLMLWDVKRYTFNNITKFNNSVKLRDILSPLKQPVSKEEMIKNKWRIISKINFGGELFLRDAEQIRSYKGKLFLVPENSIIYSKINIRHGCLYYNKIGCKPFGVSSEYPVFTFDNKKINGEYLKLLLRSTPFKQLLNTKTSGISKARVKVDEFLGISVPLVSIEKQNRIVEQYCSILKRSKQLTKKYNVLEKNIDKLLTIELGVYEKPKKENKGGLLFTKFSNLSQWGADKQTINNIVYKKNYPIKKILNICDVGSGGTPSRKVKSYYQGNIPWIKTGEVVNDIIYDTEEKITSQAIENSSAKLYPKGSLIIAMYGQGKTRGRTAKLGINASTNQACAVLHNINNSIIETDYLWIFLMNEYDRLRQLASGNNQPNLNAQMIKNYNIVIPPLDKQQEIIKKVTKMRLEIKLLENQVINLKKQADELIEKELF